MLVKYHERGITVSDCTVNIVPTAVNFAVKSFICSLSFSHERELWLNTITDGVTPPPPLALPAGAATAALTDVQLAVAPPAVLAPVCPPP